MSLVHPAVAMRRLLARRPFVHWLLVLALAAAVALSIEHEQSALRTTRARWDSVATVLVATDGARPGDPIAATAIEVPLALAPPTAITSSSDLGGRPARQHVDAGEIVTEADVATRGGPLALVPAGWRAVPIVESPRSGATVGDRVDVVSDGVVLVADGVVVDVDPTVTVVAVPAATAPSIPLAASESSVTLLRIP